MRRITLLGIDLAKHSFQVHGVDEKGFPVLKKTLSREGLRRWLSSLEPCVVAMEACSGAHYWGHQAQRWGHEVRVLASQFVKPFLKSQKNDANDAEAIVIAASQPSMRFVALKSAEQQELQFVHRYRERLVHNRTALMNQLRSMLEEFGVVMAQGESALRHKLRELLGGSRRRGERSHSGAVGENGDGDGSLEAGDWRLRSGLGSASPGR